MRELKRNYTIVIVTHNMQQAARVSDQTAFFNLEVDGRNVGTGGWWSSSRPRTIFLHAQGPAHGGLHLRPLRLTDRRGWGPSVERVYDRGVITHIVMMKLHDSDDRVEAATRLRDMEGRIPELLASRC